MNINDNEILIKYWATKNVLTAKEKEVFALIIRGLSDKEIGSMMGIKFTTVRTHVESILGKFQVCNRKELIVRVFSEK